MKILIAPLDWGLGHATRCVPIIRALRAAGHDVIPCASGAGLRLLRSEFPDLQAQALPSYAMRYTKHRALLPLWLLLQLPLFLLSAWRDGRAASRLARATGADLIIADGRYGFRAGFRAGGPAGRSIPAIFVSHQIDIIPPGPRALRALLAPALRALNRRALRGFAEIWVPDFPGSPNLSGTLGHLPEGRGESQASMGRGGPAIHYIRPLCRFRPDSLAWDRPYSSGERAGESAPIPARIDTLAVLSGPEPQRSMLEEILVRAFADLPGTRVIVRGVPSAPGPQKDDSIRHDSLTMFDHLPQDRLLDCLESARRIVCRSGYTTMMELAGLGKANVLLVPTPGQPEQEYLAVHARAAGLAAWRDQAALDVGAGFAEAETLPGFSALFSGQVAGFDLADWIAKHPWPGTPSAPESV